MVKVEICTAIWYCGLWQFYVCKEHLKSRPGSVTYRYQQKTKKTKIKMVFFNTLLLIFVDVGWVARHIIAITPEKWWNQYRRKITSLRFKFSNWKFLFRIAWKHFPIKTKDTAAAETEKTEPHDYADYGYARKSSCQLIVTILMKFPPPPKSYATIFLEMHRTFFWSN